LRVEFIGDAALFPTALSESKLGNERVKKNLYVFRLYIPVLLKKVHQKKLLYII
jgi:hypothetical protein